MLTQPHFLQYCAQITGVIAYPEFTNPGEKSGLGPGPFDSTANRSPCRIMFPICERVLEVFIEADQLLIADPKSPLSPFAKGGAHRHK